MSIRFYNFLLSFILLSTVIAHADIESEMKLIRDRTTDWAIKLKPSGDKPRKTVSEYLSLLNSDGSFSDKISTIDVMTGRLLFMAQAYKNGPKWKGNVHLKTNLYLAVQFWLDHDPGNSGWTAGVFSEPAKISSIGLCLYDALQKDKSDSPETIPQLNKLTDDIVDWANVAWTVNTNGEFFVGANVSYRLMGMITRASLANSPEMFNDITNIVGSTFKIVQLFDSGRFADGSWHQHNVSGGQNYWIGYGCDWIYLTRRGCSYLRDTRWALSDKELNTLADCILDGWQALIYRKQGTYSVYQP